MKMTLARNNSTSRKRASSSSQMAKKNKASKGNSSSSSYRSLSSKQVQILKDLLMSRKTATEEEAEQSRRRIIEEVFPDQMSANAESISTFLEDVKDVFEKCVKSSSKSKHWNVVNFGNGASYHGFSTCSSLMQYFGVYSWSDGHHYMGRFKNCNQHSLGYYSWPSRGKFFGFWKQDEMDGLGIYMSRDNVIYYGSWKNDMQHGEGIKIVPAKVNWGKNGASTVEQVYYEKWRDQKLLSSRQIRKHPGMLLEMERSQASFCDTAIVCNSSDDDSSVGTPVADPFLNPQFTLKSSPRKSFLSRLKCSHGTDFEEESGLQSPYEQDGAPRSPFPGLMRNE